MELIEQQLKFLEEEEAAERHHPIWYSIYSFTTNPTY